MAQRFIVLLAYDVPYYQELVVEADSAEEAERKAREEIDVDEALFEAGWDAASDIRVVDIGVEQPR